MLNGDGICVQDQTKNRLQRDNLLSQNKRCPESLQPKPFHSLIDIKLYLKLEKKIQTGLLWQLLNRWYAIFRKKKRRGHHTTLDPCLVQARVRGGLPVHEQVKAVSIPMSTVWGFGSVSNLGPTANERCGFTLRSSTLQFGFASIKQE